MATEASVLAQGGCRGTPRPRDGKVEGGGGEGALFGSSRSLPSQNPDKDPSLPRRLTIRRTSPLFDMMTRREGFPEREPSLSKARTTGMPSTTLPNTTANEPRRNEETLR